MTKTRCLAVAAILCDLLGCVPVLAAPITTGRQVIDINGTPMVVFTYRPAGCSDPALLLVFHGIARNARTYRDDARALADRLCLLVVAPVFDKRAFPTWRYQRGGIVKDGVVQNARDWTGTLVLDLVAWARGQEGRPLPYSLLGHSAGGQFLDRLAAFVPTEARGIVIGNAGSYVFASLAIVAPYGLGKVYSGTEGEAALRRYLEQPLTIYLGQGDTRHDARNDYPEALAQGASRYQRGLNVFNAAKTLAQARGWTFNWRLLELPGVGHNARKMRSSPRPPPAPIARPNASPNGSSHVTFARSYRPMAAAASRWPCASKAKPCSSITAGPIAPTNGRSRPTRCSISLRCAKFSRRRCWRRRWAMANSGSTTQSPNISSSWTGTAISAASRSASSRRTRRVCCCRRTIRPGRTGATRCRSLSARSMPGRQTRHPVSSISIPTRAISFCSSRSSVDTACRSTS